MFKNELSEKISFNFWEEETTEDFNSSDISLSVGNLIFNFELSDLSGRISDSSYKENNKSISYQKIKSKIKIKNNEYSHIILIKKKSKHK